jgi:hypothetical protein
MRRHLPTLHRAVRLSAPAASCSGNSGAAPRDFVCDSFKANFPRRMGICRFLTPNFSYRVTLVSFKITLLEGEPVSDIFDGGAIEIDLEFIHSLGVISRRWDIPGHGMASIDRKDRASLTTEDIKVCDIQANILPCNWGIEMMRHIEITAFGLHHDDEGSRDLTRGNVGVIEGPA